MQERRALWMREVVFTIQGCNILIVSACGVVLRDKIAEGVTYF